VEIDGPRHVNARTRGFTAAGRAPAWPAARVVRWDLMSREQQKKGDDEIMQDLSDSNHGLLAELRLSKT
jgi:hypothetical protein